jgi:hypothetical protein
MPGETTPVPVDSSMSIPLLRERMDLAPVVWTQLC